MSNRNSDSSERRETPSTNCGKNLASAEDSSASVTVTGRRFMAPVASYRAAVAAVLPRRPGPWLDGLYSPITMRTSARYAPPVPLGQQFLAVRICCMTQHVDLSILTQSLFGWLLFVLNIDHCCFARRCYFVLHLRIDRLFWFQCS